MIQSILNLLFGCRHRNLGFPRAIKPGLMGYDYRQCLDCGKKVPYRLGRGKLSRGQAKKLGFPAIAVCLCLFAVVGCGGTPKQKPVRMNPYFGLEMVGQRWEFANKYGDKTVISVEPAPEDSDVDAVWHYTKDSCRAYWNTGDCGAELWFGLKQNPDGTWYSSHFNCTACVPGYDKASADVTPRAGGYMVVPVGPGSTGETSYQPAWQLGVLSWKVVSTEGAGSVPWRTDSYFEDGMLVSEQWENCPGPGCAHEKWYFSKRGLEKVVPTDQEMMMERVDCKD